MTYQNNNQVQNNVNVLEIKGLESQTLEIKGLDIAQINDAQMTQFAEQFNQIEPGLGYDMVNIAPMDLYALLNVLANFAIIGLSLAVIILIIPSLRSIFMGLIKRFATHRMLFLRG